MDTVALSVDIDSLCQDLPDAVGQQAHAAVGPSRDVNDLRGGAPLKSLWGGYSMVADYGSRTTLLYTLHGGRETRGAGTRGLNGAMAALR